MAENQFPYQPQGSPPNQPQFAPPEKKGGKKKLFGRIGIVVAALGLVGGGAYAVTQSLDSEPEGESTPEAAAEVLFEAIDNDDIIGVTDIMLPSEREAWIEPTTALMTELARLEIVGDDTVNDGELNNFTGLEFEVTEKLEFLIEPLGNSDDLHSVEVVSGTMDVTFDAEKFATIAGDRLGDVDEMMAGAGTETETVDFADEDFTFVVAKEGDDYYASIVYTLAELAREDAGVDLPNFKEALVPQGVDSKEDVVEQIVLAALDGDLEKAAATLDPAEFRVMYDYWSLFGADAIEAYLAARESENPFTIESVSADVQERDGRNVAVVDGFKGSIKDVASATDIDFESVDGTFTAKGSAEGSDFDVTISDNKLVADVDVDGGNIKFDADVNREEWTAKGTFSVEGPPEEEGTISGEFDVDIDDLAGSGSLEGDIGGETIEGEAEFSYSDGCLSYDIASTSSNPELEVSEGDTQCSDDVENLSNVVNLYKEFSAIFDDMEDLGVVVVERDGKWFVSGVPTYMYMGVDVLKAIDKEELDELETLWEDIVDLGESSTQAFDSVLGDDDFSTEFSPVDTTIDFDSLEEFDAMEEFDLDSPRTTIDFDELRELDGRELNGIIIEDSDMEDFATETTIGRDLVEEAAN